MCGYILLAREEIVLSTMYENIGYVLKRLCSMYEYLEYVVYTTVYTRGYVLYMYEGMYSCIYSSYI